MSAAQFKRFEDEAERIKLRKPRRTPRSDEHRRNLAASLAGNGLGIKRGPRPEEVKAAISSALKDRKRSPEAIAKHRETCARKREIMRNRVNTPE